CHLLFAQLASVPSPSSFVLPPISQLPYLFSSFFSTSPAPTPIYTLSLHDALPISDRSRRTGHDVKGQWLTSILGGESPLGGRSLRVSIHHSDRPLPGQGSGHKDGGHCFRDPALGVQDRNDCAHNIHHTPKSP